MLSASSGAEGTRLSPVQEAKRISSNVISMASDDTQNQPKTDVDPIFQGSGDCDNSTSNSHSNSASKFKRISMTGEVTAARDDEFYSLSSSSQSNREVLPSDDDDDDDEFHSCDSNSLSIKINSSATPTVNIETTHDKEDHCSPSSVLCETGIEGSDSSSNSSHCSLKRRQRHFSYPIIEEDKDDHNSAPSPESEGGNEEWLVDIQAVGPFGAASMAEEGRAMSTVTESTSSDASSSGGTAPHHDIVLPQQPPQLPKDGHDTAKSDFSAFSVQSMLPRRINDAYNSTLELQPSDNINGEPISMSKHVSTTGEVRLRVFRSEFLPNHKSNKNYRNNNHQQAVKDGSSEDLESLGSHSQKTGPTSSLCSGTNESSAHSVLEHDIQCEDDELLLIAPPSRCVRKQKSKRKSKRNLNTTTGSDADDEDSVSRWLYVTKSIEAASLDGASSESPTRRIHHPTSKQRRKSKNSASSPCHNSNDSSDADSHSHPEQLVLHLPVIDADDVDCNNPQPLFRSFDEHDTVAPRSTLTKQHFYLDPESQRSFGAEELDDISYKQKDESMEGNSLSSFFRRSIREEKSNSGSALLMVTRWNEEDENSLRSLDLRQDQSLAMFTVSVDNNPNNSNNTNHDDDPKNLTPAVRLWNCLWHIYKSYEMACLVVVVIFLAKAYPPIGAYYVHPDITASWISVTFIFSLAGLGLKTEHFSKAFQRLPFNLFVQLWSLCINSAYIFAVSRGLIRLGILDPSLGDGMVICSCLPMTISSVTVMTKASDGDEASAVFNSAFGNFLGVFLSPLLIFAYLGVSGDLDLGAVFLKLTLRVVFPVILGQILQKKSKFAVGFARKYKRNFLKVQLYTLLFIVYTVFCRSFSTDKANHVSDIFVMIPILFVLFCCLLVLSWTFLKIFFPDQPKLRVMGLFGCTQKTVAMGIPLINTIYENHPNLGPYTLPLLIWYPMQLVICSFLIPRLKEFVKSKSARLNIRPDYDNEHDEYSFHFSAGYSSSSSLGSSGSSTGGSRASQNSRNITTLPRRCLRAPRTS